jgi:hypothetical protein
MRPTLEPSVRSDKIFPYYWNRTQNSFTTPQDIAVKAETLNPTDVAEPDERVWTVEAEGLSPFQLMISSTSVACWTGGPADYSAAKLIPAHFKSILHAQNYL